MSPPPDVRVTVSSLALAALACGGAAERPTHEAAQSPPATQSPAAVTGEASAVGLQGGSCSPGKLLAASPSEADEMAAFAVRHADFARRTLYSWTTAEQVQELRGDPTLLTRAATAQGEPGRAAEVIARAKNDALAALLAQPRFENKRFAWSNPWATLQGFGEERYGNHLLQITLREQAWVGSLIVGTDNSLEWAFADVHGNPVASADVLRSPERLAAVYFVDLRGSGCGTAGYVGSVFREYFVCNEAMLESFALYTSEVHAEVERSISALASLSQALIAGRCSTLEYRCWPDATLSEWVAAGAAQPTLDAGYLAALAFTSREYSPTPANVAELLRLLREVPFDEPLLHTYPE